MTRPAPIMVPTTPMSLTSDVLLSWGKRAKRARHPPTMAATTYQTDLTLKSRIFAALGKPMQRAQIKKLFAVQKRDMEAAHKAGKPPTA